MSNIISILESGNREQFHSSFIAWLLKTNEQHGLNNNFLNKFLSLADEDYSSEYNIYTEYKEGGNRYDILMEKKDGTRRIAIENKTKSLGGVYQIDKYRNKVDSVILLSLIKENYSEENGAKHIVYSDIISQHILYLLLPYHSKMGKNLTILRVMTANLAGGCHEPKNPCPTLGPPRPGAMAEALLPA